MLLNRRGSNTRKRKNERVEREARCKGKTKKKEITEEAGGNVINDVLAFFIIKLEHQAKAKKFTGHPRVCSIEV